MFRFPAIPLPDQILNALRERGTGDVIVQMAARVRNGVHAVLGTSVIVVAAMGRTVHPAHAGQQAPRVAVVINAQAIRSTEVAEAVMKRVPASVTRLVYLCSGPLPSMIKARRPLHVLVREQTPIDRTQYRLKHDVEVLCTRANNASTSTEDDDCNVGNVVRLDNLPAKQKTTTCNNGAVGVVLATNALESTVRVQLLTGEEVVVLRKHVQIGPRVPISSIMCLPVIPVNVEVTVIGARIVI